MTSEGCYGVPLALRQATFLLSIITGIHSGMSNPSLSSASSNNSSEDLILRLASGQLERMRSMQYAYHRKFFNWLAVSTAGFIVLWLAGGTTGLLWIPFAVITCGVQASFFLHFCDFARTHAAHLESAINHRLNCQVLLGAKIENDYFYPLNSPKISGWSAGSPTSFFSIFTLHWCLIWTGITVCAIIGGLPSLSPDQRVFYLLGLLCWGALNVSFLTWYFWSRRDLRRIEARLEKYLFNPLQPQLPHAEN